MEGERGDPVAAAEDALRMPLPVDKIGDRRGVAARSDSEPEHRAGSTARVDPPRLVIKAELRRGCIVPLDRLAEREDDLVSIRVGIPGGDQIRRCHRFRERGAIAGLVHERRHQPGHFRVAGRRIVAAPLGANAERRHHRHPSEIAGEGPLDVAEPVALRRAPLAAGIGPDLEEEGVAEVRHVALPMRGKLVKELPIGVAPVAAIGAVGSLIGLPLVPEDGPNPVGELGGPHPGEEPSVDRGRIGAVGGVGEVLIDPRAADGAVENADGDLVGVDNVPGEIDPPISDLVLSPFPPHGVSPPRLEAPIHRAETANPAAAAGGGLVVDLVSAPVARHRVRLAVHQEGVAAEEIVGGVEDHLHSVAHRATLDPVANEPRLKRDREGIAALRIGLERP